MRRTPIIVAGFDRLVAAGGSGLVDRLQGALEPLTRALLTTFVPDQRLRPVTSDEMNTLDASEFPREWWVRTSFIAADAPDPDKARELAWVSIEYSQWESEENWAVQLFFRVSDIEFSLSADSDSEMPALLLHADRLPSGDIVRIEEVLRTHLGGPKS